MQSSKFHLFSNAIDLNELPEKFTFPFYYTPHSTAVKACVILQDYLVNQTDFEHNFGLNKNQKGLAIGKMFGVLVCQDHLGQLGFLAGFSGKLANSNRHHYFVPPIFDLLNKDGFFLKEETKLNKLNTKIEQLEHSKELSDLKNQLNELRNDASTELEVLKQQIKANKISRSKQRLKLPAGCEHEFLDKLRIQSLKEQYFLKDRKIHWRQLIAKCSAEIAIYEAKISALRVQRKHQSGELQKRIFDKYEFLNAKGEIKSLMQLFAEFDSKSIPPAGSGECVAPKLLNYAYQNDLKPISMAEFWWGQSPLGEVRKHQIFYPACNGKCKPILNHMLRGLNVANDPMLESTNHQIEMIYEDEAIAIIHKPNELLAVPGKNLHDSVLKQMQDKYPNSTGPLIVHRLDMSTSGLMVIAKNEKAYKFIQRQFIARKVKKQYVAILDGIVKNKKGKIELPLRVDLLDRPRQMVCNEYGKYALTTYEVVSYQNDKTRIHFYPKSGRTHQLRVHAAHQEGLNAPIWGDDLYGNKADRLYLHASYLSFVHPTTNQIVEYHKEPDF